MANHELLEKAAVGSLESRFAVVAADSSAGGKFDVLIGDCFCNESFSSAVTLLLSAIATGNELAAARAGREVTQHLRAEFIVQNVADEMDMLEGDARELVAEMEIEGRRAA